MFARTGFASPRPAGFIEPCLPTKSERPRSGPQWVHEVKHDGYRLMVHRNGDRVRLFTRHGYDWTERYPRITRAMAGLKITSALIDGEAVCWSPDGADFDKLHSRAHDDEAILIAFDLLELDGEDWREQPLEARKKRLRQIITTTTLVTARSRSLRRRGYSPTISMSANARASSEAALTSAGGWGPVVAKY
jgi:ATP-dependent DNA ligase